MPANPNRKLLFDRASSNGEIIFKYWDTGSLSAAWPDAGVAKSGVDIAFLRINGLKNNQMHRKALMKMIETIAHRDMESLTLEYHEEIYGDLLDYLIKLRDKSVEWKFATFASAVIEIRNVSVDEIIKLAEEATPRLNDVIKYGVYSRFFRPDLGQFTHFDGYKSTSLEAFEARQNQVRDFMESELYSLVESRREMGLVSNSLNNAQRNAITEHRISHVHRAGVILTADELVDFASIIDKHQKRHETLSAEFAMVLAYAYVTHNEDVMVEMLSFFHQHIKHDHAYETRELSLNLDRMLHLDTPVTLKNIIDALSYMKSEPGVPFDWAMTITV